MNNWYLNRLRSISIAEIPYRVRQLIQKQYEKQFCIGKFPKDVQVTSLHPHFNFLLSNDNILHNTISVFGKSYNYNKPDIDWHKDIFSGKCFPHSFSKNINILKIPDLSAKNVWEINRLQFLTWLVLNYKKTSSASYLDQFVNTINSWIDNNPYLTGINWYSNIEVNIRLIVWYYCWIILDADKLVNTNPGFNDFVNERWIPVIYQHCRYSYANPSRYSSSNNHLIAEYAGLFIASSLWQFKESEKWNQYAKNGLEKEIIRQHSKNGINKEEAAEYIQFITDFFLISYVVGEQTNNSFSKEYRTRLKKILYYIYELLDADGNFPQYGDEDDGKCILFDQDEHFNNFRSLLTSGAILFNDPVLKSKCHGLDQKNLVLFGDVCNKQYDKIETINPGQNSRFFPEEGHFIIRQQEGTREVYIHFNAAPLGYLSIAAHGHSDALSFILHIDGHPVFVDSGTYTYHTDPEWRNFFMGTYAHNTIRINKLNQASIAGPTLWLNHYSTNILKAESNEKYDRILAQHDGYSRYGIIHTREITFHKGDLKLVIKDQLESSNNKSYLVELPFHFHPSIVVKSKDDMNFTLRVPIGRNANIVTDNNFTTKLIKGQVLPEKLGWYSKSFSKKEPCNTILCSSGISGSTNFESIVNIE